MRGALGAPLGGVRCSHLDHWVWPGPSQERLGGRGCACHRIARCVPTAARTGCLLDQSRAATPSAALVPPSLRVCSRLTTYRSPAHADTDFTGGAFALGRWASRCTPRFQVHRPGLGRMRASGRPGTQSLRRAQHRTLGDLHRARHRRHRHRSVSVRGRGVSLVYVPTDRSRRRRSRAANKRIEQNARRSAAQRQVSRVCSCAVRWPDGG